jgi:hypothetical protein
MRSSFNIGQLYAYRHEADIDETQSARALTLEILIAIVEHAITRGRTLNSQGKILRAHTNEKSMLVTAPLTRDIKDECGGWYRLT